MQSGCVQYQCSQGKKNILCRLVTFAGRQVSQLLRQTQPVEAVESWLLCRHCPMYDLVVTGEYFSVLMQELNPEWGDVVAELVERRPRDPMDSMTQRFQSRPERHKKNLYEFFRVKMY